MCLRRCRTTIRRVGSPGRPGSAQRDPNAASKRAQSIRPASCTSGCRASMMASSRGRDRSSPRDGSGFGRIGCLLHQAEEHAIMNRVETEDSSYASARNRKLLAEWAAKTGENEYAEPALNPCQTTAYAFFTGDELQEDFQRDLAFCTESDPAEYQNRNIALRFRDSVARLFSPL